MRHHIHLWRHVRRRRHQPQCGAVGRELCGVGTAPRRQARARAATHRHRVDLPLTGMRFGGLHEEVLAIRRHLDVIDLEPPRGDCRARRRVGRRVHRGQLHPAVVFSQVPHPTVVRQPPDPAAIRAVLTDLPHPRVVVDVIEHGRAAGRRIDAHQPAVGVVGGAHRRDQTPPVWRWQQRRPADVAPLRRGVAVSGRWRIGHQRFGGQRRPGNLARLSGAVQAGPHGITVRQIDGQQTPAVLRVADLGARGDLFGVGGLGHEPWHLRGAGLGGAVGHRQPQVSIVGAEHRVDHALALGQFDAQRRVCTRPRFLAGPAGGGLFHPIDQRFLFAPGGALTLGQFRRCRPDRRIDELHHGAAADVSDRHEEHLVVAHEGDVRAAACPARRRLGRGRAGDVDPAPGGGVDDDDVAAVDTEDALPRSVPPPIGQRRDPAFLVGQPARRAAVAPGHPGGRLVLAGRAPLEVEVAAVRRPAQIARRIADQRRTTHDRVDAERRSGRRGGLCIRPRDGRHAEGGRSRAEHETSHRRSV